MILWRKMARDMRGNIGSYLAALILVCIGIVTYLSFAIARDNMVLAKKNLYQDQNFADGFAELVAMPAHYLHRIRRLPDISQVTGRLIHDVQIHDPDRAEGIYLRLVSLDMREADRLNDVRLLDGEALVAGEPNIWIDQRFYDENHLAPGQTLEIIAGGEGPGADGHGQGHQPRIRLSPANGRGHHAEPRAFRDRIRAAEDYVAAIPRL